MPLLELKQLSVEQAGKMLWQDLSFSLEAGERSAKIYCALESVALQANTRFAIPPDNLAG